MGSLRQAVCLAVAATVCWFSRVPAQAQGVFPGTWRSSTLGQLAALPEGREGACADFSSALVGSVGEDRIYLLHGFTSSGDTTDVRAYDIDTNTWLDPAPTVGAGVPAKAEGAGVAVGGLVYCVGGRSGGSATANVTVYDPTANTLANVAPMGTARAGVAVEKWGKFIYAFGGRSTPSGPCSGDPLDSAERYDTTTNTWSPINPPPTPVTDATAVSKGGKIYLIGGCTAQGLANVTGDVQIYDPGTGSWSSGPIMPTARASLAAEVLGNTIYAIGGLGSGGSNLDVVEALDLDKATWTAGLTPKPTPSSEVQAVAHGGTLYLPGGGSFGVASSVFEAFRRK
ncbi:MAG TPA: kelch repeat-containing protein [Bryobacteraceae bacterium]|nr:kelch repeat-containing protein [Bryobacteraceae bacterium]